NAQDFFKKYELYSFVRTTAESLKLKDESLKTKTNGEISRSAQDDVQGDLFSQLEISNEKLAINGEKAEEQKSRETETANKKEHIKIVNNVQIVNDKDKLKQLKEKLLSQNEISINVETSGSGVMQDVLVGISLCFGIDNNYYIPLNHSDFTLQQISQDIFVNEFKEIFENKDIKFIGHDLKFIKHIFDNIDINIQNSAFDIMLASYCINPSRQHSIENLALKYLDFYIKSDEEIFSKGTKKIKTDDIDIQTLADYSCSKSVNVFYLKDILTEELKKNNLYSLFSDMEMPIMEVLYNMEDNGIKIDKEFLSEFDKELMKEISVIEQNIYSIAGETFNINSPKQLAVILFEKLKIPAVKKTKTGYSTDESVLAELSQYDIANEILKYRELQKLKGTYVDPIKYYLQYEGDRIHTIFNQAVTTTGRLSSSDPNLQNIPIRTEYGRKFRKAFVPEQGNIFISADYSQIDLRSLAHISKDRNLIFAFNSGKDIHTATAQEIFNVKNIGDVTKEQRMAAKSINFGIVYGISSFGLAKQLDIPVKQAKEYIDSYFTKYSGIKNWSAKIIEETKEKGYVKTLAGRIRYIPEINSPNKQIVSFGERMALNTPVQGTSADIIKIAMINVAKKIKEQYLKTKILLQVHDDLLLEVPENEKDFVLKILKYEMENAVKLDVPLLVDIKTGTNWADLKTIGN
ncbi:MAG: DNA polymerase I, partial [Elusimicrobia bacterium]|nr:DNA polymerase I [Elusimicrobiota bacterium]